MRRVMMDYNQWSAFGFLGEISPHRDNRVTLSDEKDRFGIPVARSTFATEVVQESRFAHPVGAARMGSDPQSSVVDGFGRTHDIANLFICDGSIMPTHGSANPGLTIMALAARIADYMITQGDAIFTSSERSLETAGIRRSISPPDTWGHGMPRIR